MAEYKRDFDDDAMPVQVPEHVKHLSQMIDAVRAMLDMPQFADAKFQFRWENVILTIDRDTTDDDISRQFKEQSDAYKNTAEMRALRKHKSKKLARLQSRLDDHINNLPHAIYKGEAAVVDWIATLSDMANHHGITYNKQEIAEQLRASGICSIRMTRNGNDTNASAVAQNLISYCVLAFENGSGINPRMASAEARRYREIKTKATNSLGTARRTRYRNKPQIIRAPKRPGPTVR